MSSTSLTLVDRRVGAAEAVAAVERRSLLGRLRGRRPDGRGAEVVDTYYWPIAVVEATAKDTGRRGWTDRTRGAIDLVSGRIGLVDTDLPTTEVDVEERRLVPARLGPTRALEDWHDYFRDWTDRRRKPLRPPAFSVDRLQRLWLEHPVVALRGSLFLVDPATLRADPLEDFPWLAQLRDRPSAAPSHA